MKKANLFKWLALSGIIAMIAIVLTVILKYNSSNKHQIADVYLVCDAQTKALIKQEPTLAVQNLLKNISISQSCPITVDYPFNRSVFPPDIVAPTFLWHDTQATSDLWLIDITFSGQKNHIYVFAAGKKPQAQKDPEAVNVFNAGWKPDEYEIAAKGWTPDEATWKTIKENSVEKYATLTITGFSSGNKNKVPSRATITFMTSKDPVSAPIFYRDVPLMPSETKNGVIKPLSADAIPIIAWRLRDISKPTAPVVLKDMATCANCHSFSTDGRTLGMDIDGPDGDKGAYGVAAVSKNIVITEKNILTWNSYKHKQPGQKTIGFFSQVSPDGRHVVSTVNESVFVANFKDFSFLQSFYATRGVLAIYSTADGSMEPLPGAADANYVQTNGIWSPDGKYIVFSRAEAKNNYVNDKLPSHTEDPLETPIQYDLYRIPFNDGKGGVAEAIEGASKNGKSNSFAKYSPDGKWIIYVQAQTGQLMRPDSKLFIIPAQGGTARQLNCNLAIMNSWHSWSPNGKWLVFSSKGLSPYTQMFLTHIDENGNDTPAILIPNSTASNRAVNIPEFLNNSQDAIASISAPTQESYRYYKKGTNLTVLGKYSEAIPEFEKSLKLNPYDAKTYKNYGYTLMLMRKIEEAKEQFNKAIELDPELADAYSLLGTIAAHEGKIDEALIKLNKAIELDEDNSEAHSTIGAILAQQNKLDEATEHLRKAIKYRTDLVEPRNNLALILLHQGKFDEAAKELKQVLKLKPEMPEAHVNLAKTYVQQNKFVEAIEHLAEALRMNPDLTEAETNLMNLLLHREKTLIEQTKAEEALKDYQKVLKILPNNVRILTNYGVALSRQGKNDEAVANFEKVLSIKPDSINARYNMALLLMQKGDFEQAGKHFSEVLKSKPDSADLLNNLGYVSAKQGNIEEAVTHFKEAIKLDPNNVAATNQVAWLLATHKEAKSYNPKEAVELSLRACELTGNKNPGMFSTLAASYAAAGKFPKAIETAEKALKLAESMEMAQLVAEIQSNLKLYKSGKAYIEILPKVFKE